MAEVLHWPHRSGQSFRRKSPWPTAAVRASPSPYRLHRRPNPQHFRRGSAPAPRNFSQQPLLCRKRRKPFPRGLPYRGPSFPGPLPQRSPWPYTRIPGPAAHLPLKKRGGSASAVGFHSASVEPRVKPSKCSSWRLPRKRKKHKSLPSKASLPGAELSGPAAAGIPVPGASAPLPENRGATPFFFVRRVGWTARRQIPALDGSFTGGHVFRAAASGIPVAGASAPIPTRRGPNPTHFLSVGSHNVQPGAGVPSDGKGHVMLPCGAFPSDGKAYSMLPSCAFPSDGKVHDMLPCGAFPPDRQCTTCCFLCFSIGWKRAQHAAVRRFSIGRKRASYGAWLRFSTGWTGAQCVAWRCFASG
jgi:hypothetical protein